MVDSESHGQSHENGYLHPSTLLIRTPSCIFLYANMKIWIIQNLHHYIKELWQSTNWFVKYLKVLKFNMTYATPETFLTEDVQTKMWERMKKYNQNFPFRNQITCVSRMEV